MPVTMLSHPSPGNMPYILKPLPVLAALAHDQARLLQKAAFQSHASLVEHETWLGEYVIPAVEEVYEASRRAHQPIAPVKER